LLTVATVSFSGRRMCRSVSLSATFFHFFYGRARGSPQVRRAPTHRTCHPGRRDRRRVSRSCSRAPRVYQD
jgi:hypothetical protein